MKQLHGGDIYTYEAAYGEAPLDFSANINPMGMPVAVRAAARDAIERAAYYPDPACTALRGAVGRREGLPADQLLCGNGAADLIYRFAYAAGAKNALVCAPTFSEYALAFAAVGSAVHTHRLQEAEGFRVTEAILPALSGMDALCLCNPNNPTGLPIVPEVLDAILEACAQRGIYVLLDECFVDFLEEPQRHTKMGWLARHPRLIVLKALTKLYAMPGLRLGYAACADTALLARIEKAGAPWSVSVPAQAAGIAAMEDAIYAVQTRAWVQDERAFMKQMLGQLGLSPMGEANFLLFKARAGLADALREEGILVRDCANFDGLGEGWVRIAIRQRAENMRLLTRLSRCLHG